MKYLVILIMIISVSCNEMSSKNNDSGFANPSPRKPTNNCNKICSEDYKVLKGITDDFSFLSFENFGYFGVGRCRGHALVTQRFAELAEFKESGVCHNDRNSDECLEHIKIGINSVMDFKVWTFEGFSSLRDFSTHPLAKNYLYYIIKNISHRYTAVNAQVSDDSWYINVS